MGAYIGGNTGSGNTHTDQVISGGKKVAYGSSGAKKAGASPVAKKTAASAVRTGKGAGKSRTVRPKASGGSTKGGGSFPKAQD